VARILIVDDEPDIRFMMRLIFEGSGHKVMEAGNGVTGMKCVKGTPPDLVTTDVMMPVMGGLKFIEWLRSDPTTAKIPILAISGNADLATAAGITTPPTTWDELKSASQKLTDKGAGIFGTVIPSELPRFGAFVFQAGGKLISDDGTTMALNSPEGLQALDYYYGLYKDGTASTPADTGTQWPGDALIKKKAAMVMEGNWLFPAVQKDAPTMKLNIAEMPAGPKGKGTFAFTVSYSINAKTQQKDAAWFLVNYLTGPQGMQKWTSLGLAMPSRKSLETDWLSKFKDREPFLKSGSYAQPWQLGPGGQEINDKVITPDLQAVFSGKMTSKDALADIEKKGNDILAKQ